ncbi:MAG TPA: hypothetical protein VGK60_01630 [Pedococcus sp.]
MSQPNDTPAPGGSNRLEDGQTQPTNPEQTEDTRVIQTDQPETGSQATERLPTDQPPAAQEPADQVLTEPAVGGRPRGPHLPAILLGLACLVIAGLVMAQELGHLRIDWGNVGPLGIVAAGAVLVVLGLVGLLTSRRRDAG